jgi:hypothetical protein
MSYFKTVLDIDGDPVRIERFASTIWLRTTDSSGKGEPQHALACLTKKQALRVAIALLAACADAQET